MRTEQDKINRREANRKYYQLGENKQQKNNIQKEQLFRAKSKTARIVKTIEKNLLNHI